MALDLDIGSNKLRLEVAGSSESVSDGSGGTKNIRIVTVDAAVVGVAVAATTFAVKRKIKKDLESQGIDFESKGSFVNSLNPLTGL
jgi:hypothetical protein